MNKPEHIINYKNNSILVYRKQGTPSFYYGNRVFQTLKDAKIEIDKIGSRSGD